MEWHEDGCLQSMVLVEELPVAKSAVPYTFISSVVLSLVSSSLSSVPFPFSFQTELPKGLRVASTVGEVRSEIRDLSMPL